MSEVIETDMNLADAGEQFQDSPFDNEVISGDAGDSTRNDGGGRPGPKFTDDEMMKNAVGAVKNGQRQSHHFKAAWHKFCDMKGQRREGKHVPYDPQKYDLQFLASFFDAVGTSFLNHPFDAPAAGGPRGGPRGGGSYAGAGAGGAMPGGYAAPPAYAGAGGGGGYGAHQSGYAAGAAGGYGARSGFSAGFAQRADQRSDRSREDRRDNRGRLNDIDATVSAKARDDCVKLIKTGQGKDSRWKQQWSEHCTDHGGGTNDPSKHDSLFILAFCFKFGISRLVNAVWANPFLESLGEVAKGHLVKALKRGQGQSESWRNQWELFTDEKGGLRDPQRQDAGTLMEFFDSIAVPHFTESGSNIV